MSAYIRLELHAKSSFDEPDGSVYSNLHALLSERNIQRSVEVQGQGAQCLPTGLYYTAASDRTEIAKDVNTVAKQVGYPYSFVIVVNGGALVRNLEACS